MIHMRNIIWRNRASAILGLMIILLALIDGFPESVKTIFFLILGGLIALFGFTSNRYASEIDEYMQINSVRLKNGLEKIHDQDVPVNIKSEQEIELEQPEHIIPGEKNEEIKSE